MTEVDVNIVWSSIINEIYFVTTISRISNLHLSSFISHFNTLISLFWIFGFIL